jgi:hypothetical protein
MAFPEDHAKHNILHDAARRFGGEFGDSQFTNLRLVSPTFPQKA